MEVITEVRAPEGEEIAVSCKLRGRRGTKGDKVLRDNARHHALVISKEKHA